MKDSKAHWKAGKDYGVYPEEGESEGMNDAEREARELAKECILLPDTKMGRKIIYHATKAIQRAEQRGADLQTLTSLKAVKQAFADGEKAGREERHEGYYYKYFNQGLLRAAERCEDFCDTPMNLCGKCRSCKTARVLRKEAEGVK